MSNKVSANDVKMLREKTGAGMMDAKQALSEANGDVEKAIELLRKKGQLKAAKKSERVANQGIIDSYIHGEGRIGVLVEVNCETDFVARNSEFRDLVHNIALQIAASAPQYVDRSSVPAEVVERARSEFEKMSEDKPENVRAKIVEGKLEKFYQEACLLDQPYVRDDKITVKQLIDQRVLSIGENIKVGRFARFVLGEN